MTAGHPSKRVNSVNPLDRGDQADLKDRIARAARRFLTDAGFEKVVPLNKPAQAQELVGQLKPDVVLLDLMMPEVSGFDVLSAMILISVVTASPPI